MIARQEACTGGVGLLGTECMRGTGEGADYPNLTNLWISYMQCAVALSVGHVSGLGIYPRGVYARQRGVTAILNCSSLQFYLLYLYSAPRWGRFKYGYTPIVGHRSVRFDLQVYSGRGRYRGCPLITKYILLLPVGWWLRRSIGASDRRIVGSSDRRDEAKGGGK